MLITHVDGVPVRTPKEFAAAVGPQSRPRATPPGRRREEPDSHGAAGNVVRSRQMQKLIVDVGSYMISTGPVEVSPIRLRQYTWALAGLWTVAIAIVLTWEISDERQQALDIARSEATGAWKKEVAVYRWAAQSGNVYVPVTEHDPPGSQPGLYVGTGHLDAVGTQADVDQPADDHEPSPCLGPGAIRLSRPHHQSAADPPARRARPVGEAGA